MMDTRRCEYVECTRPAKEHLTYCQEHVRMLLASKVGHPHITPLQDMAHIHEEGAASCPIRIWDADNCPPTLRALWIKDTDYVAEIPPCFDTNHLPDKLLPRMQGERRVVRQHPTKPGWSVVIGEH